MISLCNHIFTGCTNCTALFRPSDAPAKAFEIFKSVFQASVTVLVTGLQGLAVGASVVGMTMLVVGLGAGVRAAVNVSAMESEKSEALLVVDEIKERTDQYCTVLSQVSSDSELLEMHEQIPLNLGQLGLIKVSIELSCELLGQLSGVNEISGSQ
jgi:hypothetical protein